MARADAPSALGGVDDREGDHRGRGYLADPEALR
jgi:hypothetical protein